MEMMVVDESREVPPGGPAHSHGTDTELAICPACRLDEARADLNRAHQRLRRLNDDSASNGDPSGA